jgi:hypothetical protein
MVGGLMSNIMQALKVGEFLEAQTLQCNHPNHIYVGEESGITGCSCVHRRYTRERWQCSDCGVSWFENVRKGELVSQQVYEDWKKQQDNLL